MRRPIVVLAALLTTATAGCGTVSFKPGSTSGDYQAASERCQKEGRSDGVEFEHCMEGQGWTVKQLGAPAPGAAKEVVPPESPSAQSPPAPTASDIAPAPKPDDVPPAAAPLREAADAAPAAAVAPAANPSAVPAAAEQGDPLPKAAEVTPTGQPIVVKNWFKFGGTADELAAAQARCAAKLGVAHDPESDMFTSAMVECLRNEGWRSF